MIQVEQLSLTYRGAAQPTLADIGFRVAPGEFVLICGPTGCGKSSLLNCLNGILQHESSATIAGRVTLAGREVAATPLPELCRLAGAVFQDPRSQLCAPTPEAEIAFGLENIALPPAEMRPRIDQALAATGLEGCRHQPVETLSGGQQQRLAIACALALQPRVLLLDEPISQLDPRGAEDILALLHELKTLGGLTIMLVEHRLEDALPMADRVLVLDRGRLVLDRPRDALLDDLATLRALGLNLPHLPDLFAQLGRPERPLAIDDAPDLPVRRRPSAPASSVGEPIIALHDLTFGHDRRRLPIFDGLNLTLHRGDRVALLGANGTGKSTLLHLLAGAHRPWRGRLDWPGGPLRAGLVLQNPDLMLFAETVREEVDFAPRQARLPLDRRQSLVADTIDRLGLSSFAEAPPFALSRGQRLRTAVASVISHQPSVLLLDEPTTGQDREHIDRLMASIEAAYDLVVFCTHDMATAARHANRVLVLHRGQVIADGPPHDVFADEATLATAAVRTTTLQRYARRLGVAAFTMDQLREALAP